MPSYTFTENSVSQNSSDTPIPGTEDSLIRSANPDLNFGTAGALEASKFTAVDLQNSVIRFDTSSIPDSEIVTSAILYLRLIGNDGTGRDIAVYRVLQTGWLELEVTWNSYATGFPWNTPGCLGSGTDRASTPDVVMMYSTTLDYKAFSLPTSTINKSGNTDLMFELDEIGGSGQFSVWRSSDGDDLQRPELVVITSTAPVDSEGPGLYKGLYTGLYGNLYTKPQ